MTTETLMTETTTTTNEGVAASKDASTESTLLTTTSENKEGAQQQDATNGQVESKDETKTEGEEVKSEGAPDKYEFTKPETLTAFDDVVIGKFSEVAKELNLTQEAAQKVLDTVAPAIQQRQAETVKAMQESWLESTKADKEIGGEKMGENLGIAKKALDAFGSQELRALLNESGLGNHPEVIRMFYKAGQAISEDKFVGGGNQTNGAKDSDLAGKLYG